MKGESWGFWEFWDFPSWNVKGNFSKFVNADFPFVEREGEFPKLRELLKFSFVKREGEFPKFRESPHSLSACPKVVQRLDES